MSAVQDLLRLQHVGAVHCLSMLKMGSHEGGGEQALPVTRDTPHPTLALGCNALGGNKKQNMHGVRVAQMFGVPDTLRFLH